MDYSGYNEYGGNFFGGQMSETQINKSRNPYLPYGVSITDSKNPFFNLTENIDYRSDYRKIDPWVTVANYDLHEAPLPHERYNIKKIFSRMGLLLLFLMGIMLGVTVFVEAIVEFMLMKHEGISFLESPEPFSTKVQNYMDKSSLNNAITVVANLITWILTAFLGCKLFKYKPKDFFGGFSDTLNGKSMMVYLGVGLIIQTVAGLIMDALYYVSALDYLEPDYQASVKKLLASFVGCCIIAPVMEEFVFRGVLLKAGSVVSQRFGIIVTALMFGLLHANLSQFLLAFPIGILLGYVTVKYNSIIPSILIHMVVNMRAESISIVGAINPNAVGIYSILVNVVIGVVAIPAIIFMIRHEKLPKMTKPQRTRSLSVMLSSAPIWIFMVICAVLIYLQMPVI